MIQRIMLTADEGKILTNGEVYGSTIYLAEDADASAYYEITENEYAEIQAAREAEEMKS